VTCVPVDCGPHCTCRWGGPHWKHIYHVCLDHLAFQSFEGMSWSWSYGSWIYNYLWNQCLSPLKLWVRIPLMARCTRYSMWNKILNIKPCMGQISGTWELLLREYWRKSMIIGENKYWLEKTDRATKASLFDFDWFSEVSQIFPHFALKSTEREVKSPCFYYVWAPFTWILKKKYDYWWKQILTWKDWQGD
jgi:hypothetical protein